MSLTRLVNVVASQAIATRQAFVSLYTNIILFQSVDLVCSSLSSLYYSC